jgi:hypothetical protein
LERILKKPIVIMDGYDPQDANTWLNIYNNYLSYGPKSNPKYLGDELRALGYDIIILNFPRLGSRIVTDGATPYLDIPSYVHKGTAGSLTADPQSRNGRDGGTDFIERNGFVAVALLKKVNETLAANGQRKSSGNRPEHGRADKPLCPCLHGAAVCAGQYLPEPHIPGSG